MATSSQPPAQGVPAQSHPLNPPKILHELREKPISKVAKWDGTQIWFATRYEDVQFILHDKRFSSNPTKPGFPYLTAGRALGDVAPVLSKLDHPRHGELRRILNRDFLSRSVERRRPKIKRIVMAQLDHLLAQSPPVDLYTSFTLPIPWNVINELLGIPSLDQKVIAGYTKILHARHTTKEQMGATLKEFYAFCEHLLEHGEATHDDSFLSQVQTNWRADRLSREEAIMGILNLIVAGHVTTASVMALAALQLLLNPEQFHAMREEPAVVRNAVEELLRFDSITNLGLPRVAAEDVLVGDTLISAGDGVIVSVASANRDANVFDDPYKLDIRREGARRHMSFGHGAHKCLGQWLAKAQLQIALPALATHVPTLRLAVPAEELSFIEDSTIFRVRELPVTW